MYPIKLSNYYYLTLLNFSFSFHCTNSREDPFKPCGKILRLNQFTEFCISSTCECLLNKNNSESKCKCDSLLPFVEACESKLGPLAVRNWRLIHECRKYMYSTKLKI